MKLVLKLQLHPSCLANGNPLLTWEFFLWSTNGVAHNLLCLLCVVEYSFAPSLWPTFCLAVCFSVSFSPVCWELQPLCRVNDTSRRFKWQRALCGLCTSLCPLSRSNIPPPVPTKRTGSLFTYIPPFFLTVAHLFPCAFLVSSLHPPHGFVKTPAI